MLFYFILSLVSKFFFSNFIFYIQFWATEYIKIILELDTTTAMIGFALVTITAPIVGVIAGGRLADYLVFKTKYLFN